LYIFFTFYIVTYLDNQLQFKNSTNLVQFCFYNLHYEKFSDGTVKCIEDEIPFDVPDGWAWCRLDYLAQYKKGPFGSSITKSMFIPDSPNAIKVYEQKNAIGKDANSGTYFISEEKYDSLKGFEVFPNDIIVSCAGTIGETFVMPLNMRKGIINQALMKISLYDLSMLDFYLIYFDFKLKQAAKEHGYGVALKNIPPFDILKKYLMPIPPLKEQNQILHSINTIMTQIDNVKFDYDELIILSQKVKSKILDLAIRGKLVPQNQDDEPASVLLERIKAQKEELIKQGKIKRDKKESVIFKGEDNSYYDIELPSNWTLTSLMDISLSISDGSHNPPPKKDSGVPLLSAANIFDNRINYDSATRWMTEEEWERENKRTNLECGDVLITIVGTIGRTAIISNEMRFALQRSVAVIKPCLINSKYLMYSLQSPMIKEWLNQNAKGNAQVGIYLKDLASLTLFLPPLEEQKRIVDAIETAFEHLDNILNNL